MQSGIVQMSSKELNTKLNEFFLGEARFAVAYLLGSTARGEAGYLSDIDISILFDDTIKLELLYLKNRIVWY